MANLLNNIVANQSIRKPANQTWAGFNISTDGKVKPLEDKAKLLPSRIFGSPVEYAKDFKKDIVSIGKAVKGKANDHELGRINDLAMKAGSLGLAAYLCIKNPLKLSKAMEFVGFGTFFASMALWPKLAIQAPIKARTGVDIHQKYIDSQGRKKMLHQDPQYDLTDLYSREDLDKMGEKLGVNKNLPDRDNFIKQRAKKTAIQGNTLWMLTAGFATPIMSALACNRLEKPVSNLIDKINLDRTQLAVERLNPQDPQTLVERLRGVFKRARLSRYLDKNGHKLLNNETIPELTERLAGANSNSIMINGIAKELNRMTQNVSVDMDIITEALRKPIQDLPKDVDIVETVKGMAENNSNLQIAMRKNSIEKVADIISKEIAPGSRRQQKKLMSSIEANINKVVQDKQVSTLKQAKYKILSLFTALEPMNKGTGVIDKFINVRVADRGDSFIANQWGKASEDFLKCLNLTPKEMKAIVKQGKTSIISDKLMELAADETRYNKAVKAISESIAKIQKNTGKPTEQLIHGKMRLMMEESHDRFAQVGFDQLADLVQFDLKAGTLGRAFEASTKGRIQGAEFSLYRVLETLETYRAINNDTVRNQLKTALNTNDENRINRLTEIIKKVLLDATATDHTEKLKNLGYGLNSDEYKVVMGIINSETLEGRIPANTNNGLKGLKKSVAEGLSRYKKEYIDKIGNYRNGVTQELRNTFVNGENYSLDGIERSTYVAKPVRDFIEEAATKKYNSNKWLKIFGISMAVLTAATLIIGTQLGKKTKIEKQLEEEGKVNG